MYVYGDRLKEVNNVSCVVFGAERVKRGFEIIVLKGCQLVYAVGLSLFQFITWQNYFAHSDWFLNYLWIACNAHG